jgi:hypothetical protein
MLLNDYVYNNDRECTVIQDNWASHREGIHGIGGNIDAMEAEDSSSATPGGNGAPLCRTSARLSYISHAFLIAPRIKAKVYSAAD